MELFSSLFFLLSGFASVAGSSAAQVKCAESENKDYADCVCQMSDSKKFVNLAALKHNFTVPRFSTKGIDTQDQNWWFSYNPCTTFNIFENQHDIGHKSCINVMAARWSNQSSHQCEGLGNGKNATFHYNTHKPSKFVVSDLTLQLQNETTGEQAVISLVCNSSIPRNHTAFKHLGTQNDPENIYYLSLEGECCCPGLCGTPGGPSQSGPGPVKLWIIICSVGGVLLFVAMATGSYCWCSKKNE